MNARAVLLPAALAAALCAAAPAQADPPPWAPAHGYRAKQAREYRYVYYPAQQVYYAPEQQLWFWMSGDNWQFGVNLPTRYRADATAGVQVVLHSDHPYQEHAYVEERYGRPWRESHEHHGHGRPHGDD